MLKYNHSQKALFKAVSERGREMKNFCIFADAVNYIEENLCDEIKQNDIAAACCCSLSSLQKVWRYCTHTSLKEYISKRRLTRCAEDIIGTDMTLTEIAMKYQYNSPEVFTRAFKRLWGISPSKFKYERHQAGIFPKIIPDEGGLKGERHMGRKVDITELYNELKENRDCYVLCFDLVGLDKINKGIGRKAGDGAITEAFRRIDEMAGEDMMVFRIGGDEFAAVTGLTEKAAVEEAADKVIRQNGNPISCEGKDIPVAVRAGAMKLSEICKGNIRYNELFDSLQNVINNSLNAEKVSFISE